jgi:DNA-binding FadR family transcriptional regulator
MICFTDPAGRTGMWNGQPSAGKATKADLVSDVLRHEIAIGLLAAGANLPSEVQLMRRFAISRPTYREALRILESEGLIRVSRGMRGGARVLAPTPQWISATWASSCNCNLRP